MFTVQGQKLAYEAVKKELISETTESGVSFKGYAYFYQDNSQENFMNIVSSDTATTSAIGVTQTAATCSVTSNEDDRTITITATYELPTISTLSSVSFNNMIITTPSNNIIAALQFPTKTIQPGCTLTIPYEIRF